MNTTISDFFLLGFQNLCNLKMLFFFSICLAQIVTVSINIFLILAVVCVHHLHTPMYFFLSQLAFAELMFTISIMPKLLHVILAEGAVISVTGCIIQMFIFCVATNAESLFLTLMSYDRYVAICKPLRYSSFIDLQLCLKLTGSAWIFSFISTPIVIIQLSSSPFCGSDVINHYYCDLTPLLEHSCGDVSLVNTLIFIFSIPITFFPFVFITVPYLHIVVAILRIPSAIGKQKAFATCGSHLAVVCMYYLTLIIIYIIPKKKKTLDLNKVVSILFTVVTPLCNPIIYTLRNKEIRNVLEKHLLKIEICVIKGLS